MVNSRLRFIAESGILVGLALVFLNIKVFELPNGGSVSLTILPLLIISARWGLLNGLVICMIFGILAALYKPFIVHPIQFLLDYPLAYMSLGLVGAVRWDKDVLLAIISIIFSNIIRLFFHVISGIVFFSSISKNILSSILYSFWYNISHVLPEVIIAIIFTVIVANKYTFLVERQNLSESDKNEINPCQNY